MRLTHLAIWKNPVLIKEIRTRMRGYRAAAALTAHLVILSLAVLVIYMVFITSYATQSSPEGRRSFGQVLFGLVIGIELLVVSFTAPSLTASAIAAEKEHQTYDILRVTLLSPRSLVLGKYLASLVFLLLLLFTSLPVQTPAYLIGGATAAEILVATLVLIVTAMTLCAAGIFASSLFTRTVIANVFSFGFSALTVFGLPLLLLILVILFQSAAAETPEEISPALEAGLLILGWLLVSLTPTASLLLSEIALISENQLFWVKVTLTNQSNLWFPSPWLAFVLFYLGLTAAFLWASMQRVRRKER